MNNTEWIIGERVGFFSRGGAYITGTVKRVAPRSVLVESIPTRNSSAWTYWVKPTDLNRSLL